MTGTVNLFHCRTQVKKLSKRILFTKANIKEKEREIMAVLDEQGLCDIDFEISGSDDSYNVGDIYVAKIAEVKPSLNGMFVNLSADTKAYLPSSEIKSPVVVNKYSKQEKLVTGDEILVQIIRDPIKTKDMTVSTKLSVEGKGFILTSHRKEIGVSKKLKDEEVLLYKDHAKDLLSDSKDFGIILRTNVVSYDISEFDESLRNACGSFNKIINESVHLKVYSLVKKAVPLYVSNLLSYASHDIDGIISDDENMISALYEYRDYLPKNVLAKVKLYEDDIIPLATLYGLKNKLAEITERKVHLNSGANILIEPTETMCVIDVNSAKNDRKASNDYFLKINIEAAKEIARQIKLRNISGMILVDFINMRDEESKAVLLKTMRAYLKTDKVKSDALDITKLGLMEITRQKIRKSVYEILG